MAGANARPTARGGHQPELDNILTMRESGLMKLGSAQGVIDVRAAFQPDSKDQFTAGVERLTRRRVVAFLSANQTRPGCARELFFFLDGEPVSGELQGAL